MRLADADSCRDHRAARDQKNPTAFGEGWPATTRAGTELRVISYLSPSSRLRGHSIPAAPCLLPEARFSSTHKVPERSHSGARRDLVPTAEGTRCNVPDHRENYGF
ncbi:MAG: hypothetical protein V3V48_02255 [Candidatus Aminicenantaceae bacterium]